MNQSMPKLQKGSTPPCNKKKNIEPLTNEVDAKYTANELSFVYMPLPSKIRWIDYLLTEYTNMGRGASGNEDRGTFNNLIEKDKKFCINAFSFSISFSPLAGKFPRMGIPYYCDQQLRKKKQRTNST